MKIYVFEAGKYVDFHVAANDASEAWSKLREHYLKEDRHWNEKEIHLCHTEESGVIEVCD